MYQAGGADDTPAAAPQALPRDRHADDDGRGSLAARPCLREGVLALGCGDDRLGRDRVAHRLVGDDLIDHLALVLVRDLLRKRPIGHGESFRLGFDLTPPAAMAGHAASSPTRPCHNCRGLTPPAQTPQRQVLAGSNRALPHTLRAVGLAGGSLNAARGHRCAALGVRSDIPHRPPNLAYPPRIVRTPRLLSVWPSDCYCFTRGRFRPPAAFVQGSTRPCLGAS